ncbi:Ribonuclease H [Quillaja saponaria]|uniref:Ribonuclease H n=1 Tax=Quillaja saponaria TaxID=32244 RepID=A0AAD7PXC2_QUISA|nr:Ribonuclease H [Quillaja saponaria]KAJ7970889.1 Ribonuclease H [Quillaja saponaria]
MEEEKDAFYVVRKGDVVGIYKSLSDFQDQLGSSVCDSSASVYKGYCLPKKAEEYFASHGLKNSTYSIGALNVIDGLFGELVACPYQHPDSSRGKVPDSDNNPPTKRLQGVIDFSSNCSCILEFDGASKGNPGLAGAGAVLRAEDGSQICRLREGVGVDTNNVAEYRALILGLRHALKKGYRHVCAQGDSLLVCKQVQGLWKTKNQNMAILCKEARELKDKFLSFQINHVLREFNSEADTQANLATNLRAGQVEEDCM